MIHSKTGFWGWMVITVVSGMLMGCGPMYETQYSYRPPASFQGRQCVNQCLRQKSYCEQTCRKDYDRCKLLAAGVAHVQYKDYQANDNNRSFPKNSSDFYDDSSCSQDCGCVPNYNACYSNCGGEVGTHQQCVAFCGSSK